MDAAAADSAECGDSSGSGTAETVFVNPLPASAAGAATAADAAFAEEHQAQPAQPADEQPAAAQQLADEPATAAEAAAKEAAQPAADDEADASEAHSLLSQRHTDSAAAAEHGGITTHHSKGDGGYGQAPADSDDESVSLDSQAAGRPPGGTTAAMTNPYWQINCAMRNPLAGQAPKDKPSSRGHQVG